MNPTGLFFNARKAFRATGQSSTSANSFVGLGNFGQSAEFLVVWYWSCFITTTSGFGFYKSSTLIGTQGAAATPSASFTSPGPGYIYTGSDPAGQAFDFEPVQQGGYFCSWTVPHPFAIISPHHMLNISNSGTGAAVTASFVFTVARPEEVMLDTFPD